MSGDPFCPRHGMTLCQCALPSLSPFGTRAWQDERMYQVYCDPFEIEEEVHHHPEENVPIEQVLREEGSRIFRKGRLPEPVCRLPGRERFDWSSFEEEMQVDMKGRLAEYLGDEQFALFIRDCLDTLRRKNTDYTAGRKEEDRIANFRTAADDLGLSMEKVWFVYAYKHWSAIVRYCRDGQVESEPIRGRIIDMVNYLVLLDAILAEGK